MPTERFNQRLIISPAGKELRFVLLTIEECIHDFLPVPEIRGLQSSETIGKINEAPSRSEAENAKRSCDLKTFPKSHARSLTLINQNEIRADSYGKSNSCTLAWS